MCNASSETICMLQLLSKVVSVHVHRIEFTTNIQNVAFSFKVYIKYLNIYMILLFSFLQTRDPKYLHCAMVLLTPTYFDILSYQVMMKIWGFWYSNTLSLNLNTDDACSIHVVIFIYWGLFMFVMKFQSCALNLSVCGKKSYELFERPSYIQLDLHKRWNNLKPKVRYWNGTIIKNC